MCVCVLYKLIIMIGTGNFIYVSILAGVVGLRLGPIWHGSVFIVAQTM